MVRNDIPTWHQSKQKNMLHTNKMINVLKLQVTALQCKSILIKNRFRWIRDMCMWLATDAKV